jgi:hypothetical protein
VKAIERDIAVLGRMLTELGYHQLNDGISDDGKVNISHKTL